MSWWDRLVCYWHGHDLAAAPALGKADQHTIVQKHFFCFTG
jgi:hypothetical protein